MSNYRALTVFDALPDGCISHPVERENLEPHLHYGEVAVVDLADREPQHGELYLVQWSGGQRSLVQARRKDVVNYVNGPGVGWYVGGFVAGRPGTPEFEAWLRSNRASLSEGPMRDLTRIMVGRVIGVLQTVPAACRSSA